MLLLTAACGGGDDNAPSTKPRAGTIADVTVTGELGAPPEVTFKAPMTFAETESKTVIEGPGTGSEVIGISTVTANYVGYNASDGEEFATSWDDNGKGTPADIKVSETITGLSQGLEGAHAGDRVLITIASKDGFDPIGNGTTVRKGDSLVMVVDVEEVSNPTAIPESKLPELKLDDKGVPEKFVARPDTPDDVGLLGVYTLREGKGDPVESDQTLTVRYLGQIYPDGTVFDESFSAKKPATFSLSGVIAGWQQGLLGQRVGSRVVLTIPSELGYGEAGSGADIPPNSDLIFVVDIIKAK
jgi:peptidylprolyl isomerase